MSTIVYKVGELKQLIRESTNEFSPVKGPNVDTDNKRNNEKSYKDAEKAAKDFDGGLKPEKKGALPDKVDGNRTTLDYNPRTTPDQSFRDKVDAQSKGYTSKLEEDNGIEKGGAEFDKEGKIAKTFKDANDKAIDVKHKLATSGIQGHNMKDENPKKKTMYESAPKAKRLLFKHTKFLNEGQMLTRIPEEYKVDGQKIFMKDCAGNEYIVECSKSEKTGIVETNVVGFKNEKLLDEQISRMEQLFNYKHETEFAPSTPKERVEESQSFQSIMDLARDLIK